MNTLRTILKRIIAISLAVVIGMTISNHTTTLNALAASKKPGRVTIKKVKTVNESTIKVTWKKTKNAKKYQVYRSTSKNGSYKLVKTTKATSFKNTGLFAGTKYYYKIRAINGKKKGAFSKKKYATTKTLQQKPIYKPETDDNDTVTGNDPTDTPVDAPNTDTTIPSTPCEHDWYVSQNTNPTCTVNGTKIESCSKCGETKTTTLETTGHSTKIERIEPTCGTTGTAKEVCEICGTVISTKTIPVSQNHNWETKILSEAAAESFYEGGLISYVKYSGFSDHDVQMCSNCKVLDMDTVTLKYSDYEACEIMLGYVNDLRMAKYGDSDYLLTIDNTLLELAKIRAKEISENFSHFTGTYTNAAENITAQGSTLLGHFEGWKNSDEGHYENMLYPTHKYFAYALYNGDLRLNSGVYGVQLFWSKDDRGIYMWEQMYPSTE